MSDQYKHYPASFVMRSKDINTLRITDIWKFKSTKTNKWYIVEMEHFDDNLIAVKFYYKAVRQSKQRYSLLTNDFEPRTIVYSCLDIMKQYYLKDNTVSFGFVAASDVDAKQKANQGNRRFRFYRTLVLNYFGIKTFVHVHDTEERLYLLLNRERIEKGEISLDIIASRINQLYLENFNFSMLWQWRKQ